MSERFDKATALIRRYSYWSAGFGLIPVPVIDLAAITGTQIKMVRDLSAIYEREFSEDMVRASVGALVGAALPIAVGGSTISALKTVPIIGQVAGTLLLPALAAASTIAVGRVFVQHFEAGGTLLDFDPEKMKAHFEAEFRKAKDGPANDVAADDAKAVA
jgi:uncharacterized protein (DUF697 family)